MTVFEDNLGAISLARTPETKSRVKHLDIKHHFIREKIKTHAIDIKYIETSKQVADMFTKPQTKEQFQTFRQLLRMKLEGRFMTKNVREQDIDQGKGVQGTD